MTRIFKIGIAVSMVAMMFAGCYNDNSEDLYPQQPISTCDTANISFSGKIQPILNQHCALSGCHQTGSSLGGYILDTYDGAKATANSNRLMGAIKWLPGHSQMPKNAAKLSDCDILKIETWVNRGMPNN